MTLAIFCFILFVLFVLYMIFLSFQFNNRHDNLHNQYRQESYNYENAMDEMWQILAYKYHLSNDQKDKFMQSVGQGNSDVQIRHFLNDTSTEIIPEDQENTIDSVREIKERLDASKELTTQIRQEHDKLLHNLFIRIFIFDKEPMV